MANNIAVVSGWWSTNIGNSFFQLSAKYLLEKVLPDENIIFLGDQPGFWNVRQGNHPNAFLNLEHVNIDYLVLSGPVFRPEFDRIYLNTLKKMQDKGIKIIILAAGMMDYTEENIAINRAWLKEIPPFLFTTRDSATYEAFKDIPDHAYDGIDIAFFVSDLFQPVSYDFEDSYVVFNFDQIPEPDFRLLQEGNEYHVSEIKHPGLRKKLSKKFKVFPFIDGLISKQHKERINDYRIIRTDHRFNPYFSKKVYKANNSYVSDVPYSYLNIYANSHITFTNRVHATVATLSFGNYAMYFSDSPRAKLLERIGVEDVYNKPIKADLNLLKKEKDKLLEFVKESFKKEMVL